MHIVQYMDTYNSIDYMAINYCEDHITLVILVFVRCNRAALWTGPSLAQDICGHSLSGLFISFVFVVVVFCKNISGC